MDEEEERQARNLCVLAGIDPSAEVARVTWSMKDAAVAWLRLHPSPTVDPVTYFKHAVMQAEFAEIEDSAATAGYPVMEDLMDVFN